MRRAGLILLVSFCLVRLADSIPRIPTAPLPHDFMNDESRCIGCHHMERDGDDWLLDAHLFTVSIVGACRSCHPEEQMGRSHPVDVDPFASSEMKEMPEQLPLQWSDDARSEVMTCGTCHNPHLPRYAEQRLFSRQRSHPEAERGMFLTYYLRVKGKTPREGFTPLCHACHPKL